MSLHCIRGCIVPRRHLQRACACDCHQGAIGAYPCSIEGGCYEAHQHPDDCKGCLPREAAVGQVCVHCHGRLAEAIGRIPDLIEHLRAHIEPGSVRRDDMPRASGKHSPAPLNLDAVDTADCLYAVLADWHDTASKELDLSEFTPAAYYLSTGRLQGVSTVRRNSAVTLAERLSKHLDRACIYEWVGDMVTELDEAVKGALRRYPDEERPLYLPTPCPACDNLSLVRYAPQSFEGHSVITCKTCKNPIAEDLYGWQARKVLAEKQEEARALAEQLRAARETVEVGA